MKKFILIISIILICKPAEADNLRIPLKPSSRLTETMIREVIKEGGGEYVGMMEYLVLFNHPITKSTLAIPLRNLTIKAARDKIGRSSVEFRAQRLSVDFRVQRTGI